ncbi:uncharacterized protein EDB91DRAFT_1257275 [Suillus paluster]|uniref:uncharacterized protein n=1 Tax=Suillus paluster TaxID=48578 RepID=UPI001B882CD5|nr:uncharacterized protein EDB91DRAFT_1257275 [Suillus paluster]KAG1719950.1 hypothetical protein EDB91DRAFT_1257275 [Suillus paluster]
MAHNAHPDIWEASLSWSRLFTDTSPDGETEVIHQEAQDHFEEQQYLAEEEHEHHMCDFNEQWEAALREREQEKQEIHTWQEQQQALLRKNVAKELAWHEAKISARKDQELTEELARHNTDLNTRKNQELEERERAIFAKMERRLQLEIEKMKVEKDNKLTNMEQHFTRHGRQQHAATEIGTDPTQRNAQQPPQMPQKPQFKTLCLETIKKIRKARGTTHKMHLVSAVENAKTLNILLEELKKGSVEEEWPFQRSDGYYKVILEDHYKQLQMVWRAAQPKHTAKGSLETAAEVEERLIPKRGENLKSVCQTTCWRNKYLHRAKVLEQVIELKKDGEDEDLPAWHWLQKLIKMLGDGGMSSEESDIENNIKCVLWVKNMAWCHGIEQELNIINNQRVLDDEIFAPQGSKPMKRIHTSGNLTTVWNLVTGLPKALYNGRWFDGLTGGQVERLNVSDETFRWMTVGVA